jgi:hypothetical protein
VSKEAMNRHKLLEAIAVMGRVTGSDDRALATALEPVLLRETRKSWLRLFRWH